MTHAAIEVTADMRSSHLATELPSRIVVWLSPACFNIVGVLDRNKIHPETVVDAQFSVYYQVSVVWLYGSELGWTAYHANKIEDKRVAELCDRVEVVSDENIQDLEVRMSFFAADGDLLGERGLVHPLGEDENPFGSEKVRAKFRNLAQPVYGTDVTEEIITAINSIPDRTAKELIDLL